MRHEIINLKDIELTSINKKYTKSRHTGNFILTDNYRDFKTLLTLSAKKVKLRPPYSVEIYMQTYIDIDNPLKCILDSLQISGVIENDRKIEEVHLFRVARKRGALSDLNVFVRELISK